MSGASTSTASLHLSEGAVGRGRQHSRERMDMAYEDAMRLGEGGCGGPQTWFANRSGIDKAAVSRMVNGVEDIHNYAWCALDRLEDINDLRARALKAEQNTTVVLLEDAAEAARRESERLQETIDLLRDLCRCPNNRHDGLEDVT